MIPGVTGFAVIVLLTNIALAQSNSSASSQESRTTTPPSTSAENRQAFRENVRDVYFAFNSVELSEEARAILAKNADWLKAHPDVVFTIEGDADERGGIVYNLVLSDLRAQGARDALVQLGVPENQILFATGWGKLYPVCNQSDEGCWSRNRRSHLSAWPASGSPEVGTAAAAVALQPNASKTGTLLRSSSATAEASRPRAGIAISKDF